MLAKLIKLMQTVTKGKREFEKANTSIKIIIIIQILITIIMIIMIIIIKSQK
jgi:hypothetical protein